MKNSFLDLLHGVVEKVKQMNTANPNVKTADATIFESVKERFQKSIAKPNVVTEEEYCEDICEEIDQVQVENEADPNVETADNSVFEKMKAELDAIKAQMAAEKAAAAAAAAASTAPAEIPTPSAPSSTVSTASNEVMAMTNSMGGSLALRAEPHMGAATNQVRVPESSLVKILEYSENSINLDGKDTRFVLVQFGDQQGWIFESYLNFN